MKYTDVDLSAQIRNVILQSVSGLAGAKSLTELDVAVREMFRMTYIAVEGAFLLAGMCGDRIEHEKALRFGIPVAVAIRIGEVIDRETLIPYDSGQRILRVFELFRHHVDPSYRVIDYVADDDLADMLEALRNDWTDLAIDRTIRPPVENSQPTQEQRAAARETRLRIYQERVRLRGVDPTFAAIYRAADVDRNDFRDWRHGILSDDSKMSRRIESVIAQ